MKEMKTCRENRTGINAAELESQRERRARRRRRAENKDKLGSGHGSGEISGPGSREIFALSGFVFPAQIHFFSRSSNLFHKMG